MGTALVSIASVAGYLVYQDSKFITADAEGCFPKPDGNAHTVAIIDASEPRFDEAQRRDLVIAFNRFYKKGLKFNERFSVITTEEGQIGSVPSPVLSFCRTAKSSKELEAVGAAPVIQAFLERKAQVFAKKTFKPLMAEIFSADPDDNRRQKRESPILEQIQSVSRMHNFSDEISNRRLILVSDLMQSTAEVQFCLTKGHLPGFEKFKSQPYFDRIKPSDLSGVEVKIYMLIRADYGGKYMPHCSEDELRMFWRDYFTDAGASRVDIIRLRMGRDTVAGK